MGSTWVPSGCNLGWGPFGPKLKLPGNSYWAFGPKVGLRPTKDCIEEGEGKAPPPLQKIIFSPDYAKIKKKVLHIFFRGGGGRTYPPPPKKKKKKKKKKS